MTHSEILEYYRAVLEDESLADDLTAADGETLRRFVLVERCQVAGADTVWITTHDTKAEAGEYHATQEHPEDWEPERLYDTETGAAFLPEVTRRVSWTRLRSINDKVVA